MDSIAIWLILGIVVLLMFLMFVVGFRIGELSGKIKQSQYNWQQWNSIVGGKKDE